MMSNGGGMSAGKQHLTRGRELMSRARLQEASHEFLRILQLGEDVLQRPGTSNREVLTWAGDLHQAGISLNMLQASSQAIQCFSTALRLAASIGGTQGVACMASSLAALVHTYLHLPDCSSASSAVRQYHMLLETNEVGRRQLAEILLELGLKQVEQNMCRSAPETLKQAYNLLDETEPNSNSVKLAKVFSALGYCYLCSHDPVAVNYLEDALEMWRAQKWPAAEAQTVLNTMKHYLEAKFREKMFDKDGPVCCEMLDLHRSMTKYGLGMQVADAFTYLGTVAFHQENEIKATAYFEQALTLYKQAPSSSKNHDEIIKLLRFMGVACYNGRDFYKAAGAYHESLQILEQQSHVGSMTKLSQIAECCASLGFTYSRLRDFDNMLKFYERALELEAQLAHEDLQLIETNIGSLYHVKAVKNENEGDMSQSRKYYERAEQAFNRALRYSWKSFPYINYGYYLLCRGQFDEAASVLQQGYLNGVIDKDTVEFDHTEDPILLDDLRFELEGCEDIRLPAAICALYLKTLAQTQQGNIVGARHTAAQLKLEVDSTPFSTYYVEGFGARRMQALSCSLVGYAFRTLGWHQQALKEFQHAWLLHPSYTAAEKNCQLQQVLISEDKKEH